MAKRREISMSTKQRFGGDWTIEKLSILSSYLDFYITALKEQPFCKLYIDAFAGTGYITVGDTNEVIEGSAKLALNAKNKFDRYIFIEKKRKYAQELEQLVEKDYSAISNIIDIMNADCNDALLEICRTMDWYRNRAILFLDPYATEVKWATLETVASTRAIDVWYLFPMSAANRMLKKDKQIDDKWKAKLDMIFGDNSWEQEFYIEDPQVNLFNTTTYKKEANINAIKDYICKRLETIFPAVSKNPRMLYNTKNSPLFLFCFAVSNPAPSAIRLAMRAANYILTREV
jgi:three-Cys-motif partner protein